MRVYLDTAQWIDLAEGKLDRRSFEAPLEARVVRPTLSSVHVMELARQEPESRRRVAEYMDEVRQRLGVGWIRGPHSLARMEVRSAYFAWAGMAQRPLDPFVENLVDSLDLETDWFDRAMGEGVSIGRSVEQAAEIRSERPEHEETRQRVPLMKKQVRESRGRFRRLLVTDTLALVNSHLPRTLETDCRLQISITEDDRQRFLTEMSISSCPTLALRLALHEGWIMGKDDRPSDYEDYGHLGGIAYCDVAFADRQTCEALRVGRATIRPKRNGEFPEWVQNLR